MNLVASNLPAGAGSLREAIASSRSARNLASRRTRRDENEAGKAERASRARRRKDDRELEELLRWRVRIQIPPDDRVKVPRRVRLDLFHRSAGVLPGVVGITSCQGHDGFHSIHFDFTPRGFASRTGRRWRPGEAARAGLYVIRADALEDGDDGWWSNCAADRDELFTFLRTLEGIERQDRANANVYVSEIIALPAELDARQRRAAIARAVSPLGDRGLPIVVGMHRPDPGGDQRNFHCHIIYSLRPFKRHGACDWSFALGKEQDINTPAGIAKRRREVVRAINDTLEEADLSKRYTHLSNAARGMPRGQKKIGQAQTWLHRWIDALEGREVKLSDGRTVLECLAGTLKGARDDFTALTSKVRARLAFQQRNLSTNAWLLPTLLRQRLSTRRQDLARESGENQAELDRLRPQVLVVAQTRLRHHKSRTVAMAETATNRLSECAQDRANQLTDTDRRVAATAGDAAVSLRLLGALARLGKIRNLGVSGQDGWLQLRASVERRLMTAEAGVRAGVSAPAASLELLEIHRATEDRRRALASKAGFVIAMGAWLRWAAGELDVLRPDVAGRLAHKANGAKAPNTAAEAVHSTLKAAIVSRLASRLASLRRPVSIAPEGLPTALMSRLRDKGTAVAGVRDWSDAVLRQVDRDRENFATAALDRPDGASANVSGASAQDPARAAAVTRYAEFLRSDEGVRFVRTGDLDVVDLDSLPEEWKRSAEAFDEEPEVRDVIDGVCDRRRREELLARKRAHADEVRRQIIAHVENSHVPPVYWDGRRLNVRLELLDEQLREPAADWADDPQLQAVYCRVRHRWEKQGLGHAADPAVPAAAPGPPGEMDQFDLLCRAVAAAEGSSRSS